VNISIKAKFKIKGNKEHISCSIRELEDFVVNYLELFNLSYKKEDIHNLSLLNIALGS